MHIHVFVSFSDGDPRLVMYIHCGDEHSRFGDGYATLVMVIHVLVMDIQKSDGCTGLVMRIQFPKIGDADPRFGDGGSIPNFFW